MVKDLARSLSTVSVRIVEVIPGKSVIGLEIPNETRELVCLSEIVKSKDYDDSPSALTLALGKDIAGIPWSWTWRACRTCWWRVLRVRASRSPSTPWCSACFTSHSPNDVRLIMIDPKMLELSVYEGIPQLLAPVVTDMKEAAHALRWCVAEMERRYQLMSALGFATLPGTTARSARRRKTDAAA